MSKKIKICIILGTRPEIIKMAPVIRECNARGLSYFVLHTGQHYSKNMNEIFFKDLNLLTPKYNLKVGGQPYRKQVGVMVKNIIAVLMKEKPNVVIVQGDTISALSGALAANKIGIKLAHHEAGLRSHDASMLEEVIRVIIDNISDFLFAPTNDALKNLRQEGLDPGKIVVTGNTIVDAVLQNIEIANQKIEILEKLNLEKKGYILITCHRAENVDKKEKLEGILKGLELVFNKFNLSVIFPIHPRTKNKIAEFNLSLPKSILPMEPVGFLEFLQLEKNAKLILTDSGGVQEEAFILGVPCVTLRDNTERPETVRHRMNIVAGTDPIKILKFSCKMINKKVTKRVKNNPFGGGNSAKIIIDTILNN